MLLGASYMWSPRAAWTALCSWMRWHKRFLRFTQTEKSRYRFTFVLSRCTNRIAHSAFFKHLLATRILRSKHASWKTWTLYGQQCVNSLKYGRTSSILRTGGEDRGGGRGHPLGATTSICANITVTIVKEHANKPSTCGHSIPLLEESTITHKKRLTQTLKICMWA